jgi:hypothetical protein
MGWTVWGLNTSGDEIFCFPPYQPRSSPSLLYDGFRSFLVVKWPGRDIKKPLPSSAEVKERIQLYLLLPLCASMAGYQIHFSFTNKAKNPSLCENF